MADPNAELVKQQEAIADQLERTNKLISQLENQRYLQMVDRPFRFLSMAFLQGVAVALGSTIGLAVIVTIVVFVLRKLEVFTPIGDTLKGIQDSLQNIKK